MVISTCESLTVRLLRKESYRIAVPNTALLSVLREHYGVGLLQLLQQATTIFFPSVGTYGCVAISCRQIFGVSLF